MENLAKILTTFLTTLDNIFDNKKGAAKWSLEQARNREKPVITGKNRIITGFIKNGGEGS